MGGHERMKVLGLRVWVSGLATAALQAMRLPLLTSKAPNVLGLPWGVRGT